MVDRDHAMAFRSRFDPRHLELDVEARRQIAHDHREVEVGGACATCSIDYPCLTLCYLAAIFADHPAYDPEWDGAEPEASDAWVLARERVDWIDEDRAIADYIRQELPDWEIAAQLGISLTRVRRTSADLSRLGGVVPENPEEIVARCVGDHGDRDAMLERLRTWPYTFATQAPRPAEGGTTGTWDDIEDALFNGWLMRVEFDVIRAAVAFPPTAGRAPAPTDRRG